MNTVCIEAGINEVEEACVDNNGRKTNESDGTGPASETKGSNGTHGANGSGGMEDLYELLQISPYAGSETVHRIYRFLAARYHRITRIPAIRICFIR